jgi:hypothetical protein
VLLHKYPSQVVLVPVFFNGQPRQALALLENGPAGVHVRVLSVMLNSDDTLLDKLEHPASFAPPGSKETAN